ncbi:MAG: alpha-ketoacid dehydrogenase subunit beta [Chloroflexi bacterium]|nr:alpha-ketoacid dehydrogenase subunit beta [Chloroflexota bacterium]
MPEITIRDALQRGLREALDNDPNVYLMGEDIGAYGGAYSVTAGFLEDYGPERVRDVPISENTFIGTALGSAVGGLRPVVEFMSISFSLLAFDQMINIGASIRYMSGGQFKVPVVIRAPTGAGIQLAATHSHMFENWLASVPGFRVVAASTPYDALGLLRSALKDDNPVIMAEHVQLYGKRGEVPDEYFTIPLGKADVKRTGEDITIVAFSHGVVIAMDAAGKLAENGVKAEVIDLRSLRPLDIETVLKSVAKTHRAALIDENWRTCGYMAEVSAQISEKGFDLLDGPVARVASEDVPAPYSRPLEQMMLPNVNRVLKAIEENYGI